MSMILAAMMCLNIAAPVSAVEARGALCPDCGGNITFLGTTITDWELDTSYGRFGEGPCEHGYAHGTDIHFIRYHISTWRCNRCYQATHSTSVDTDFDCHGYNVR